MQLGKWIQVLFLVSVLGVNAWSDTINVFAASSTKLAMGDIVKAFETANPKDKINVTYAATGKAYAQFSNGFAYDIFMAADTDYPAKIVSDGNAIGEPTIYAYGVVALYSHNPALIKMGMDVFKSEKVKHISIANPRLAPYGVAALEILKNSGLEAIAKPKLVLGDNIAQSVQFVDSGAADIGLVAFSLIKSSKDSSEYQVIDPSSYTPMKQSFVVTKYAKDKKLARKFADFIVTDAAKKIFKHYGFESK